MHFSKRPKKAANDFSVLLRTVLGEDRFPVDVKALAMEVSKNFEDPISRIEGIEIDGFEGMLRASRKKPAWRIFFNTTTRYPGRQRFTLAHEFGHYVMHRRPLTVADYANGASPTGLDFECSPLQSNKWKEADREREEEADTFASFLLMPIDDYRQQVSGREITRSLLNHVTNRYGVSLLAAVRKWIDFTEQRAAMVVARDGFALWGRASERALRSGIFITSGMEIPTLSIAARGPDAQRGNAETPISLEANVWGFQRSSEPVRELTIFSQRLGLSISLLLFDGAPATPEPDEALEADTYDVLTGIVTRQNAGQVG
ncbi:ImmA/IrrE family metallo-endopeptidase [Rhodopseudomonas boonkerdii]|uniref:ImmA/IrrE family metallo-endopeptidase n=1 Tax=Rhodopseudomonas boonkerdii TaxID=475937 RepID=UPI001E293319|nr:ImmA/IrrE family metallo-endopeptidase [Rhodopseudomonas boonkerdii]UGV24849.1 ImmA/IrrE family metallo-endopeptidase [Rhodopseudomonas boonkerdii]